MTMRALIPSACLLLLAALGGCTTPSSEPQRPIPENPNRFTYHTADHPYAIHFAAAADKLSSDEMKQLQEFLKTSSARPEDKVTVSGETSLLGQKRSARVRDVLVHAGLDVGPGVDVNLAPNTVNIVLTEQVVDEPPKCGDWPLFAGDAPQNAPSLYLGCALRNNLYQEVANKRDLAVGQTPGPGDAEPGMRAVQKYREGTGDKNKKDDSASQDNSAGDSATGAAGGGASMGVVVAMASDELTQIATGPRLLACLGDPASAQVVRDFAAAQRWRNAAIVEGGVVTARDQLQSQMVPNLLVVDVDDTEDPVQALYALAEFCPPEMSVIAIGQRNDLNLYRDLIELGVTDYLPKPIDVQMLERALKRSKRSHGGDEPSKAQVITLMGARGGVGTTTVAAGLAWCLSHLHNRSVAVVDLDLHFGNLALSLDLVPGPGLREALEYPARMDARLLGSAMLHESPQLSVLAAEEPLVDLPLVSAGAADALVTVLRADCDFIIVDLPRHLEEIVRRTITVATTIGVVTDLSLAAARDTLRLVEFNRILSPTAKHMVIGNQVGAPHRGEVGRSEFERVVGLSLDGAVPFESQAALTTSSTGTALPAALRNSKAAAELAALAEQICGVQAPKKRSLLPKKLVPGLPSWFKRSA